MPVGYLGFTVPNEFVVGYGLDYRELYRNLPFICVLKRDVYEADQPALDMLASTALSATSRS